VPRGDATRSTVESMASIALLSRVLGVAVAMDSTEAAAAGVVPFCSYRATTAATFTLSLITCASSGATAGGTTGRCRGEVGMKRGSGDRARAAGFCLFDSCTNQNERAYKNMFGSIPNRSRYQVKCCYLNAHSKRSRIHLLTAETIMKQCLDRIPVR